MRAAAGSAACEWKGTASHLDVLGGGRVASRAGWTYRHPTPAFAALTDHVAAYPAAMDACTVGGRGGPAAAGRLLRRLDHRPGGGSVQGLAATQCW
jgi:hypothetical protein